MTKTQSNDNTKRKKPTTKTVIKSRTNKKTLPKRKSHMEPRIERSTEAQNTSLSEILEKTKNQTDIDGTTAIPLSIRKATLPELKKKKVNFTDNEITNFRALCEDLTDNTMEDSRESTSTEDMIKCMRTSIISLEKDMAYLRNKIDILTNMIEKALSKNTQIYPTIPTAPPDNPPYSYGVFKDKTNWQYL
ncbi:TPA_asm: hypothetical protein [Girado virus 1]|nr:TPA_asm: hypothetical protein [Girado virus 1]